MVPLALNDQARDRRMVYELTGLDDAREEAEMARTWLPAVIVVRTSGEAMFQRALNGRG